MSAAQRDQDFLLFRAFRFPINEPRPLQRLWWVLFLALAPILDFVLFRGWRLAIVRRITLRETEVLPPLTGFFAYCFHGIVLWAMTGLYALPGAILLFLFGRSLVVRIFEILWWLIEGFLLWREVETFWALAGHGLTEIFVGMSAAVLYFILMGPTYRAGMLRYAAGGGVLAFLNFPRNLYTVLRNPVSFYGIWILDRIFWLVWTAVGLSAASAAASALGALVVLAPLAPVAGALILGSFLTVYHWTSGYMYGQLALQARIEGRPLKGEPRSFPPSTTAETAGSPPAAGPTPAPCSACGVAIQPDSTFCPGCGQPIGAPGPA